MAGSPGLGLDSYVQIGRESAGNWGTKVAATQKFRLRSGFKFGADPDYIQPGAMFGQIGEPDPILGITPARCQLSFDFCYEDFLLWLDTAMGTATYGSNGGSTTGAGPTYVHTFLNHRVMNSLSLELVRGNIPSTKCEFLTGAKVKELTLEASNGTGDSQLVKLGVTMVGKQHQTNQTPTGSLSFRGTNVARFRDAQVIDGANDTSPASGIVTSFRLRLANDLAERDAGGAFLQEPIWQGYTVAELTLRQEFATRTLYNKYLTAAQSEASPNNPSVTLTSSIQSLAIVMTKGFLQPFEPDVASRGIITQEFTWRARYDSGDDTVIKLIATNTNATITT